MANAYKDENDVSTLIASSATDGQTPVRLYADPTTHRLLVDLAGSVGTVTDFVFTDGNGFDGTVTTSTTTPTLSLTTSLTLGSIPFIGAAGALLEDNADLFWSASTDALQLGEGASLEIYNLKTDATNYERIKVDWSSNIARIWTQNDGTGSTRALRVGAAFADAATSPTVYTQWVSTGNPSITNVLPNINNTGIIEELYSGTLNASSGTQTAVAISPTFAQTSTSAGIALTVNPSGTFGSSGGLIQSWQLASSEVARMSTGGVFAATDIRTIGYMGWGTSLSSSADTFLLRDAADILAQRDGTDAQTFRIYNTFTNASNYERLSIAWGSNTATILTESAGTGASRDFQIGTVGNGVLQFKQNNTARWTVNSAGLITVADNTYDIGASGATRPRTLYVGTSILSPQVFNADNAIAAVANAATVTRAFRNNVVTNSSAATLTITMSTTSATGGDMVLVQILDFSAAAQTITWVNTENSTVTAPVTSNGSTTLPLTVGFKWNPLTSKWRTIASA